MTEPDNAPVPGCLGTNYGAGCRCAECRADYLIRRNRLRDEMRSKRTSDGRNLVFDLNVEVTRRAGVLERWVAGELSRKEAAALIGRHVTTFDKLAKKYKTGGVEAIRPRRKHGTYHMYLEYGCRCMDCKRANADKVQRTKVRRIQAGKEPARHGTGGYGNYGCKCLECSEPAKRKMKRDLASLQSRSLVTATRRGHEWTGPELEILTRTDMSLLEKAKALGRTYHAVKGKMSQLNTIPRDQWLAGKRGRLYS